MRSSSRPRAAYADASPAVSSASEDPAAGCRGERRERRGVRLVAGRDRVDDDLRALRRGDRVVERRLRATVAAVREEHEDPRAVRRAVHGGRGEDDGVVERRSELPVGDERADGPNGRRLGRPGAGQCERLVAERDDACAVRVRRLLEERRSRALRLPQGAPAHRLRVVDGQDERLARAELACARPRAPGRRTRRPSGCSRREPARSRARAGTRRGRPAESARRRPAPAADGRATATRAARAKTVTIRRPMCLRARSRPEARRRWRRAWTGSPAAARSTAAARAARTPRRHARPRERATNRSWSVTTSPSMPAISVICVTLREPSTSREMWTSRSNPPAICSRIALIGSSMPAISTSISSRCRASRAELAWTVVSEPSWPVFIAWSMSSVSAPRTSPTMMRSGRIRSALRTRSRMRISPSPSTFGGRDSSETTCR